MTFFDNPLIAIIAILTSITFTCIAAMVPPNAGNLVGAIFMASMGSYLGGEEVPDAHELELEDADA
ncbi:hypothetical protein BH09SUM1_BH09SUM1_15630 [soil metagenome]